MSPKKKNRHPPKRGIKAKKEQKQKKKNFFEPVRYLFFLGTLGTLGTLCNVRYFFLLYIYISFFKKINIYIYKAQKNGNTMQSKMSPKLINEMGTLGTRGK